MIVALDPVSAEIRFTGNGGDSVMRSSNLVLLSAVGAVVLCGISGGLARADARVWTDHIPSGKPYEKPPLPARAQTAQQLEAALAMPPPPALEPLTVDALRVGILEEITRLKADVRDPGLNDTLDALGSLYGGDMAGPFWVDQKGFVEKARQVAGEMSRADEYALDPSQFRIPSMTLSEAAGAVTQEAARGEVEMSLAVMAYARDAFGMQFEPNSISLWLDNKPEVPAAGDLLARVASAQDPAKELRTLHPSHPTFEALRVAYLVATGKRAAEPPKAPERIANGPLLKVGDDHPQVALVRERLGVPAANGSETYFDRELGSKIRDYLRKNGKSRRREINDDVRALLNAPPPPPKLPDVKTIEANMLRWRWLPRDLGQVYVWNNIPEFMTRVVSHGDVIHEERIIVGQASQQTPVFSDKMDHIVFKPQWGVPNSIKITDLLPKLRGGDYSVLARRGMKIVKDGREVNASQVRWASADIRYLSIVQGPGDWNPLGEMKFMFPNHHSVYMHDTTSKGLFSSSERTFSHGCIRVRNPRKLAEVIFKDVQGWDVERIPELLGRRGEENNTVDLDTKIFVHNVYFTLLPDGRGGLRQLRDVYGHDRRIEQALAGKSLKSIADNDPARIHKRRVDEIERSTRYSKPAKSRTAQAELDEDGNTIGYSYYQSSLGASSSRGNSRKRKYRQQVRPAWPPFFGYE